ncbi:MAG: hypothetical protein C4291_00885 [Candidatus Dadabacteria bacterium]
MLLDLLRKSQGWFVKGILILLAITFVVGFGFNYSRFGFGGKVAQGNAAEVNGEGIPILDFYRARDRLRRQYQQSGAPEGALNYNFIDIAVLDQLIDLKLLSQKAKELGFRVTDQELSESIKSDPAFQVDGRFIGGQAYRSLVEQGLNESVSEFEKRYRDELLAQKLVNFIFETASLTDNELFNIYRIRNEKVNLYFVSFSPGDFRGHFPLSEDDIKRYYESHKGEFKTPELRKIRYIVISPKDFENKVNVFPDEIASYYNAHLDEFKTGGETRPLSGVKEEIETKIKKRGADALFREFVQNLQGLLNKESLDEIAKSNGLKGADEVGPFSANSNPTGIPPQVVERAFSVKKGEKTVSQSGDKVYAIDVADVIPSREKSLKEAEDEIREHLTDAKAKEIAEAKAKEILKIAQSGEGLEKAAISLGLHLDETGYFSRVDSVPKVNSDELKVDAFLLTDKSPLAPRVYVTGDKFYVVSLKERREADHREFIEKKAELRENELSQMRRHLYIDLIRELRQTSKIAINQNLISPQG